MTEQLPIGDDEVATRTQIGNYLTFYRETLASQGTNKTHLLEPLSCITIDHILAKLSEQDCLGVTEPFPAALAFTECLYEAFYEHFTTNAIPDDAALRFYKTFMKQYVLAGDWFFREFGNLTERDVTFFSQIKPHLAIPDVESKAAYCLHVAFAGYGEVLPSLCSAFAESNIGKTNLTALVTEIGDRELSYAMRHGDELSGISIAYKNFDLTTSSHPSLFVYAGHPNFTTLSERNSFSRIMDALLSTSKKMVVTFFHSFEKRFFEDTYGADNRITLDELEVSLPESELTLFSYCAGLVHYGLGAKLLQKPDEQEPELERLSELVRQMYALDPTGFESTLKELFLNHGGSRIYDMIARAVPQTYAHTMVVQM